MTIWLDLCSELEVGFPPLYFFSNKYEINRNEKTLFQILQIYLQKNPEKKSGKSNVFACNSKLEILHTTICGICSWDRIYSIWNTPTKVKIKQEAN